MPLPFSPLNPPTRLTAGQRRHWGALDGASRALAIAELARGDRFVVVVTRDTPSANRLEQELRCFLGDDPRRPQRHFPDWETLPYDPFSPHQDIISARLESLYRLPEQRSGLLICPVATLMQRLPPTPFVQGHTLLLKQGDRLNHDTLRQRLTHSGYRYVAQVMEHGEFSVRGSLIDLFPMGSRTPYRIELFDDEVELIRTFDPESQRSSGQVDQIRLLPAREFPTDEAAIRQFRERWRAQFSGDPQRSVIYRDVSNGLLPAGIEYWLPLFFETTATLFDYLPADSWLLFDDDCDTTANAFAQECHNRWQQRQHLLDRPPLPPAQLFLDRDQLNSALKGWRRIDLHTDSVATLRHGDDAATATLPALTLDPSGDDPAATLRDWIDGFDGRVLLAVESAGRREALLPLLARSRITPREVSSWEDFVTGSERCAILIAPLERGMQLADPPLALITESQLFGNQVRQRRRRQQVRDRESDTLIRHLAELQPGAPVVHEDYGVGRYLGLERITAGGGPEQEFLTLEYAAGAKLYVPVASLQLISRYTGIDGDKTPLHRLGSGQWEKARRRAAEKIRDVAAELLDIYARRAARRGHACTIDTAAYARFAAAFPFEETPDQEQAIHAVLTDLAAPQPMDRLVCGDVGFGKTEVAMRAAFITIMAGRQVAMLVPTTLLAEQHLANFRDRFADWPVQIESLSRFQGKGAQRGVIEGLANGKVDLVIGTHKLLQSGISYHNLGLVIIDEEHRFGVRQKEQLKALRAEVDLLTLTATPIPRTLNMALGGLRDLSIIATPPARRLAVKTFVSEWQSELIQEACRREMKRGGQIYFLHNDVATMPQRARELEALLPEATLRIAHGQMRERELEQVMSDFYHQRFNLLLCTTIIETGIDVPSANTIIIERADRFGLAQLYQLRGRVGRSHHRAYAWLLVPPKGVMSADAKRRLEAIAAIEELGTGFTLATHDLEIRGAGELLGDEQSGQMQELGFTLYSELLERAVAALREGQQPDLDRPLHLGAEIDLALPALIPDEYLPDVHSRLMLYKRIASAPDMAALDELQVEMIDRFGLLPQPVKNLFRLTTLRQQASRLGIRKIELGAQGGRLQFVEQPTIDPQRVIALLQQQPQHYRFDGPDKLRITVTLAEGEARLAQIEALLQALGG